MGFLPILAGGLGLLSALEGSSQQGEQNQINEEQLQLARYQQHLGKLLGMTGASGNPFSSVYSPIFQGAPDPFSQGTPMNWKQKLQAHQGA